MILAGVLLVWTPAILLVLGLILTRLTGCAVDEAGRHPCRIAGIDIGGLIQVLVMMGWLMIPLLPLMALTVLGGLAVGAMMLFGAWQP
ncbi:hypothetical protein [Roseomonas elaeocarpi]|uniref:Uncharacterized protein n=1 Tax=Roseomonas elaeocarpi TaxID=907779 RepID=A0ABV6JSZ8_9PROT